MGENTAIAWTDHTWNPFQGCRPVSPGCLNCYMYREKKRYGQDPTKIIRSSRATFQAPSKYAPGSKIFVCSWSDFFIEDADEWRDDAWDIIRKTPHLIYQILTKRPENIKDRLPHDWPLPNVWLGVTAENQDMANKRVPVLLAIDAVVRFVSIEPMIGPVDIISAEGDMQCLQCQGKWHNDESPYRCPNCQNDDSYSMVSCNDPYKDTETLIDWVICGGETGPGSREMSPLWAFSLKKQCEISGTPFFMKQMTNKKPIPEALVGQEFPEIKCQQLNHSNERNQTNKIKHHISPSSCR